MARTAPFEAHTGRYEAWFERNPHAYAAEVRAVRRLLPDGDVAEVGVGTGRFAASLGISRGVEPSAAMADRARARGITVERGVAEDLPWSNASLDGVLLVTTVCFVDDLGQALTEALRVLRPRGAVVIGMVDRASPLGAQVAARQARSPFYAVADLLTASAVLDVMARVGFTELVAVQTLLEPPGAVGPDARPVDGHGEGGFVVLRGQRPR